MKKVGILLVVVMLNILSFNAVAKDGNNNTIDSNKYRRLQFGTIKNGALYCVSQKKMIDYDSYVAEGFLDLAQSLMDDSDCFIKGRDERVIVINRTKKYTEARTKKGFRIWTRSENVIVDGSKK